MKKKVLNMIVCGLLVASLVFNGFQYSENQKLKEQHLATFQQEVSFTIQRLEGYQESGDEAEYTTAISHIYAAYVAVSKYDALTDNDEDLAPAYSGYIHDMWNKALFYPDTFKHIIDIVLEGLRAVKLDHDLTDLKTGAFISNWFTAENIDGKS